jgi:hypothetical protein
VIDDDFIALVKRQYMPDWWRDWMSEFVATALLWGSHAAWELPEAARPLFDLLHDAYAPNVDYASRCAAIVRVRELVTRLRPWHGACPPGMAIATFAQGDPCNQP